uniref:CCHC-type domain-containing protein n=1 Tax=Anabas testudineus TaxID=64144 RepID=A0AAQ6IPB9_ANATE
MVESRNCVQREEVYRWFSSLTSAQRAEFLCGLLDLCVPIELRFLGSCLEDLARKDYHSLRDAEIKANNSADLSGLTNITDEVVRSKLLVSLSLLGSDNREAARVLYRTLTHIDTVINNYGLALNDGRTGEEFLLLFTMASNHPAFSFHQKQVLRQQLSQIQDILQVRGMLISLPVCQGWSDGFVSSIVRSHQEVTQLLSQLSSLPPPVPTLPCQSSTAGGGDTASQPHPHHSQSHLYSQLQQHSQHHLHQQTSSQFSAQPPFLHLSHSQPTSHSHSQPPSYSHSHSQSRSQSHTQPPSQSQPNAPEQNGILDWLRRLRLHKYYPVFKQLTMEEFLALTEEDLNKYDLTQGAKKKLKTQLELQKSADHSCLPISQHIYKYTALTFTAFLNTPHCICVSGPDAAGAGPEKDRSCLFLLNSNCPTGSSRPTAQVLPVQTDPAPPLPPSVSSHLPFSLSQSPYHPQASYPQTLLSPVSNPARILTSPRKPRPPPLCTEDRTKPLCSSLPAAGSGFSPGLSVGVGVRLESLFPGLNVDGSSALQDSVVCRGLMVETSSALTSTSNSLHHVSHPPLHFHLSSSSSPSPSGYYSCPPTSSSSSFSSSCASSKSGSQSGSSSGGGSFVSMATGSNVPVAAVPGNTYYPPQPTSSPSPSPAAASSVEQSSSHTPSMCVCSSCGCRGNCGAYGALPGYAATGYLQPFSAGPSLFTLGPLLHLSPLIAPSSAAGSGATPFSNPMMVPPPLYRHSPVSQDQQQGFGFYQPHGLMGNGGQKWAARNLSCYNCGGNGHRAEDCKQAHMDSTQQGTFRLKYTPRSDSKDSGD